MKKYYLYLKSTCSTKEATLAIFLDKLGCCIHPAKAITPFHFSIRQEDGSYSDKLECGHICEVCGQRVDIKMCEDKYIGVCNHT